MNELVMRLLLFRYISCIKKQFLFSLNNGELKYEKVVLQAHQFSCVIVVDCAKLDFLTRESICAAKFEESGVLSHQTDQSGLMSIEKKNHVKKS